MRPKALKTPSLPTGDVTFLFTDIEGSTRLWERFPSAMQAALADHDTLLRRTVASFGGWIVKGIGDGVHAVFENATDAVAACLAAQREFRSLAVSSSSRVKSASPETALPHALKVRMGLHTGVAQLRNGDYFGAASNRAARIASVAHGDQILLSAATAERVRSQLPTGISLRDIGEVRLKGLLSAERLFQIIAADLRQDFPPIPAVTRHSLPAERDRFIGRAEALADLEERLNAGGRLISVVGVGGSGKTRLVTHFGWISLGEFTGGVWFCDLSRARSLDGLVHSVAKGLDVPLGKSDPVEQIASALAGRGRCLVLLDNFEQVAHLAEETIGRWLERAGDARFVVTSREILGIAGEIAVSLPPLTPVEGATLFLQRAGAAKQGFHLTAEDETAVGPLITLLDGLPLAIELAAARTRIMPPRILLSRMSERFKLLSSMGRRPERHAALRATFDWSWDLLSLPEKTALAQLSVFDGGFTLAAAEALLDFSAFEVAPTSMDAIQSLVDKSLVRQVTDSRFGMLDSVQEYATSRLETPDNFPDSGPSARSSAELRHWQYFSKLDEQAATAEGCIEIDNLVTACRRAAASGDTGSAVDALVGSWAALKLCGPFRVGAELAGVAAKTPNLQSSQRAVVCWVMGSALYLLGKGHEARSQLNCGLNLARAAADLRSETLLLCALGDQLMAEGRTGEAQSVLDQALSIAQTAVTPALECKVLNGLGALFNDLGRLEEARVHYQRALDLARSMHDRRWESGLMNNLAILLHGQGHLDEARLHYEQSLMLASETGDRRWEGNARCNLGLLHQELGRSTEAHTQFELALTTARQLGHARLECTVLCNLGILAEYEGKLEEARARYEEAVATAHQLGEHRSEGQFRSHLGLLYARLARFEDARACLEMGEGLLRKVSDPLSLGLLLCNRAEVEHLARDTTAGRAALTEAQALLVVSAASAESELGRRIASLSGALS